MDKKPHEMTYDEFRELYQRPAGRKGYEKHFARVLEAEKYWNDLESGRRAFRSGIASKFWDRYQRHPSEKELYHLCYLAEALEQGIAVDPTILAYHKILVSQV